MQENIGIAARNLRALVTKSSFKERYKTAQTYLTKLKFLTEDVSCRIRIRRLRKDANEDDVFEFMRFPKTK